jgi:hypothetical protein
MNVVASGVLGDFRADRAEPSFLAIEKSVADRDCDLPRQQRSSEVIIVRAPCLCQY